MKPTSLRRLAVIAGCFLLLSASAKDTKSSSANFKQNTHYYYYLDADDSYDGYRTVADEIVHLEQLTGYYVDTSPFGGYPLASGYPNNDYPHTVWPSSHLYIHY